MLPSPGRRPHVQRMPGGGRLHLQDGPIDLIIEAYGAPSAIEAAYSAALARCTGLLDELCAELPALRAQAVSDACGLRGPVARRMHSAVVPFAAEAFVTPMAAVAGSVAEEVLAAMLAATALERAYVNNGGDIALHLAPGAEFAVGLIDRPDRPGLLGSARIRHGDGIAGIATSGWRGRSFSLGIADAVTVLALTASMADAAATMIANAVDVPRHPAIARRPAQDLQPDSDLGQRLVTVAVGPLTRAEVAQALAEGCALAERTLDRGLIRAAALHLNGETRIAGDLPALSA
jgi:ApbE superfamily uncharacterized protein (UPF0280 family)